MPQMEGMLASPIHRVELLAAAIVALCAQLLDAVTPPRGALSHDNMCVVNAVLALATEANDEDIKRRYRYLSQLVHPDKNRHERAREAFVALTPAPGPRARETGAAAAAAEAAAAAAKRARWRSGAARCCGARWRPTLRARVCARRCCRRVAWCAFGVRGARPPRPPFSRPASRCSRTRRGRAARPPRVSVQSTPPGGLVHHACVASTHRLCG